MGDDETVIEQVKGLINVRTEDAGSTPPKPGVRNCEGPLSGGAGHPLADGDAGLPVLNYLGIVAEELGEEARARERYEECIELACGAGLNETAAMARKNLGKLGSDWDADAAE
jgi:hypothetical protein